MAKKSKPKRRKRWSSYRYRAELVQIMDGDTFVMDIDLGFHVHIREVIRLLGANAPEKGTAGSPPAMGYVRRWFNAREQVFIETKKNPELYCRWLGRITDAEGNDLAEMMVAAGHAVEYYP